VPINEDLSVTPTVSVIVPVGPGAEWLAPCLRALGRCRPRPEQVIVVIDGAGSELAELARQPGFEVVVLPDCEGPAAARNHGAARSRSEILLFVDSDVEAPADVVGLVARAFAGPAGPSALFGSYDDDPAAPGLVSRYRNLLHHWVHQHGRRRASTFWSGCGAVRRWVFETVGGFPERSDQPCIEDIAFGARLRAAGHEIELEPSLQVRHLKRWSFAGMVWTDLTKRAIPWSELMIRHRRLLNDLNTDLIGRTSVALVAVALVALAAAAAWPAAALATAAAALGLVAVNLSFYRFLARRHGIWFAIRAVPLHWLYYLICGVGFVIGAARAMVPRRRPLLPVAERAKAA
jgi:glycosyltransferase involved in cell wall biosynthesis